MNEIVSSTTFVPIATAIIAAVSTFIVTRLTSKKDLSINDRQQLSKDTFQFMNDLREEMRLAKNELMASRQEIAELREEIISLREANIKLEIELRHLRGDTPL